jgi:2'-5' RNA ligase
MRKKIRTFIAVELNGPIRARADELIAAFSGTAADVKWVEPQNLHLTLKFLGEVRTDDIAGICRAVSVGAKRVAAFELDVRGAGAFPNAAKPHTIWLGAGDGAESMVQLHDAIEAELAKLGFREERRRFQPHLTIGRVRGMGIGITELGQLLLQNADTPIGRMNVQKVTVFSSTLLPEGPVYEVIGSARLGGG